MIIGIPLGNSYWNKLYTKWLLDVALGPEKVEQKNPSPPPDFVDPSMA